jgi:NitT/TauT family transport system ATP-binding protein
MDDLSARAQVLPILDVQGVTKRFAFGAETITALSDASLSIGKGEFICLIGPSGCGKSTLLRAPAAC